MTLQSHGPRFRPRQPHKAHPKQGHRFRPAPVEDAAAQGRRHHLAAALAGLGSQFAGTIGAHLRGLTPQPVLAVRVVPDGQFMPATPLASFALVPTATGHTPAALTQADLAQESLLDPLPRHTISDWNCGASAATR